MLTRLKRIHEAITSNGVPLEDPEAPKRKRKKQEDEVPDYGAEEQPQDPQQQDPNQPPPQEQPQEVPPEEGDPEQEAPPEEEEGEPQEGEEGMPEGEEPPPEEEQPMPEEPPQDETKQIEVEVFSNLPPEQIEMMKIELKGQYIKLFESIDKSIDKLSKSNRTEDNIEVINFVVKKLINLREFLETSLTKKFDDKTYVENKVILERHMVIFATLIQILEESSKVLNKNKEKDKDSKAVYDTNSVI